MKPHATSRVSSPTASLPRPALAARRPREAWITDPNALLAALEHAAHPVEAIRRIESARPAPAPMPSSPAAPVALALAPEPPPSAPALRDDERIGRASDAGVVVIIRRRRAA